MQLKMFGKTTFLETQIDELLDTLSQAGLLFDQISKHYLGHGNDQAFKDKVQRMREMEQSANRLTSAIGRALYTDMLIPDSRSDVLSLIQDLDYLIDIYENISSALDIEHPDIAGLGDQLHALFAELVENTVNCVEATVVSARSFFKDIATVEDKVHKIGFYESEVDEISKRIKKEIFDADIPLDRKMHLRYFVDILDNLSDQAEDTGEWLSIYTIKRSF